jgi:hypothetical protein
LFIAAFSYSSQRRPLILEPLLSILRIGGAAALPVHIALRFIGQLSGNRLGNNSAFQFALSATFVWGFAVLSTVLIWLIIINIFGTN